MYGYIDPLEHAHEQARRLHHHHEPPQNPVAGPSPDPLFAPSPGPLGGPVQYLDPYSAMLGMPPGNQQIANVLGPMYVEQQRAEARRMQYRAQASGCATVLVLVLAFAATLGAVLAARSL